MKNGFEIEGKMLNIDLLLKIAKENGISPENMSKKMGMGHMYLRNRKNENKHGIYRTAYTGIVELAMNAFNLPYDSLVIDIPSRRGVGD